MRAATGGLPCKVLQKASGWLLTQLLISVIRASEINIVPTVFCHHRQATPRPPKRTRGSDFNGRRWVQAGETVNSQIRWALEGRVSVSANLHGNSPSRGKGGSSEGWKDFWKKKKKNRQAEDEFCELRLFFYSLLYLCCSLSFFLISNKLLPFSPAFAQLTLMCSRAIHFYNFFSYVPNCLRAWVLSWESW